LNCCTLQDDYGLSIPFVVHTDPEVHAFRKHCLLNGLDDIGLTLLHQDKISFYEKKMGIVG